MSNDPDPERVQESAQQRQHDMAEHTEHILEEVDALVTRVDYPTTSEELAVEYGDQQLDLPNETESLGSVFDRLVDEQFESPEEAREAVYNEITGQADSTTDAEYNDERALGEVDDATSEDRSESGASDL